MPAQQQTGAELVVCLALTVDLTGRYGSPAEVAEEFQAQTQRVPDCDVAVIRLGTDAVRWQLGLGRAIAGRFFLAARRIEIHAPAGAVQASVLREEAARYVRLFTVDHEAMTGRPAPTG